MRTAVVRVGIDPSGDLSAAQLRAGMVALAGLAAEVGADVVDADVSVMPASRREVEVLMVTADRDEALGIAMELCGRAFGTTPVPGVVTYVSRGTDDDVVGVLSGLGLTGDVVRLPGTEGWDVVEVTLRKADLARVPESRIHTALEASLNCEVRILAV